jgi:hypothetical protein
MAGFVAAATIGAAVIGSKASSSAASKSADAAVSAAQIEAESAERAAEIEAEAFRRAAAEQERGVIGSTSVLAPDAVRPPGPVTETEFRQFDAAVRAGNFNEAARIAAAADVPVEIVTRYVNQNADKLRLPGPVTEEDVSDLMIRNAPVIPAAERAGGIQRGFEMEARASEKAAAELARANLEAARVQTEQADRAFAEQQQLLGPFREAGVNALARIQAGLTPGGEFNQPFTTERFQADPGYAFRFSEGQKALERQAAARGGLISGSALKAATRFGQEMGSQEFQNAFNRYYAERQAQLDPLFGLYSGGMATSGDLASFAGTRGANVANFLGAGTLGAGEATARGMERAGAARTTGYLEDLQARAQGMRDLATVRASAYTGPAQFQAEGVRTGGASTAAGQLRAGEAQAAGRLGQAAAITNALNTGLNYYQNQQLINQLRQPALILGGGI